MNESIYYIVDDIHNAITNNKKIRFEYLRWNLDKKMERRKDKLYEVSPWALIEIQWILLDEVIKFIEG